MHKIQMYESLRDMLEREVKELSNKSDLDAQGYANLHKVVSTLKDVNECIEEEESMEGASYAGRGRSRASYARGGSRARGGQSNDYMMPYSMDEMSYASRERDGDGDGRYYESRDNFRDRSYRGRSNERSNERSYARGRSNEQSNDSSYGYSRDNSRRKMVQKLETLMDDTMSEYERTAIEDCIEKIK